MTGRPDVRAARAGGQSHIIQDTITRPGPHGCPFAHSSYLRVSCRDVADLEAVEVRVGAGLAGWDELGGVGWLCGRCRVGFGRGRAVLVRGAAAEATCGMGDGRPGVAVRVGCLPGGLAVALNGGSVLPQVTSPQPAAPGRTEWPGRVTITRPASTAVPAPIPNTAYRGCRASAARHRPVAW